MNDEGRNEEINMIVESERVLKEEKFLVGIFSGRDVLILLHEHYQKEHPSYFETLQSQYSDWQHAESKFWRSCLRDEKGKAHYSSLPVCLLAELDGNTDTEKVFDMMVRHVGQFEVNDEDGTVYFKSKKAARRSLAMSILEDKLARCHPHAKVMCHTKQEAVDRLRQYLDYTQQHDDHASNHSNQHKHHHHKVRCPAWAHTLQRLNVQPSDLTITFRQYLQPSSFHSYCEISKAQPTLICAVLNFEHSKPLLPTTIIGQPHSSKGNSLASAVSLYLHCFKRQYPNQQDQKPNYKQTLNLFKCSATSPIQCAYPLPKYCNANILPKFSTTFYLYKLTFSLHTDGRNDTSTHFISKQMAIKPDCTTRIGVLFPADIPKSFTSSGKISHHYQAKFVIPSHCIKGRAKAQKDLDLTVELNHRTIISLGHPHDKNTDKKDDDVQLKIHLLQQFNRKVQSWKMYGKTQDTSQRIFIQTNPLSHTIPQSQTLLKFAKLLYHGSKKQQQQKPQQRQQHEQLTSFGDSSRTYMFVPLVKTKREEQSKKLIIDWEMLHQIDKNQAKPYLTSIDDNWSIPFIGSIDLSFLIWTFFSFSMVAFTPVFYIYIRNNGHTIHEVIYQTPNTAKGEESFSSLMLIMKTTAMPWETSVGILSILMALFFLLLKLIAKPKPMIQFSMLQNRFLVQHKPSNSNVYVIPKIPLQSPSSQATKKTSFSYLMSRKAASELTSKKLEYSIRKFNLNLSTATFADYYLKKYGQRIRYPHEQLINVCSVEKHSDYDLLHEIQNDHSSDNDGNNSVYIIPELTYVLPMPRDILYMCQHAGRFMMPIERLLELNAFASNFVKMGERVDLRMQQTFNPAQHSSASLLTLRPPPQSRQQRIDSPTVSTPLRLLQSSKHRTLPSLLDEATTCTPCVTYERLEFLGDKVLGYYLSINLMARNANLQWDSDDLGEAQQVAVKNATLTKAALRVGLSRLISVGHRKWQSAYARQKDLQAAASWNDDSFSCRKESNDKEVSSILLQYENFHHTDDLSDSRLSDISESVLACLFLKGVNEKTGRASGGMVIALLEEMELPLPEDKDRSTNAGYPFFTALGPCLDGAYPFEIDRKWKQSLIEVGTVLYCHHEVVNKLDRGRRGLMELLQKTAAVDLCNVLEEAEQRTKILSFCALFDDSLAEVMGDDRSSLNRASEAEDSLEDVGSRDSSMASEAGLVRVALLRDTLFFVGNYALCLAFCSEFYHRYPKATSGDMHLLLACTCSDDVLAYIALKNGIHKFMYDEDSESTSIILAEMKISDARGRELWGKNEGWILPGGVIEFRNRCQMVPHSKSQDELYPQYKGLAAGRFFGHKEKLPNNVSEDAAFSMKAIAGSLVLSMGLENMWQCLGPLFEELLILSAEELRREYSHVSDIPGNYQQGHR